MAACARADRVGVPRAVGQPVDLRLDAGQRRAQLVAQLVGELPLVPQHRRRAGRARRPGCSARSASSAGRGVRPEPAVDVVGAPPARLGAHLLHRPQRPRRRWPAAPGGRRRGAAPRRRRVPTTRPAAAPAGRAPATCCVTTVASCRPPIADRQREQPHGCGESRVSAARGRDRPGRRPAGRGPPCCRPAAPPPCRRAAKIQVPTSSARSSRGVDDLTLPPAPICSGRGGRLGPGAAGRRRPAAPSTPASSRLAPTAARSAPRAPTTSGRRPGQPVAQAAARSRRSAHSREAVADAVHRGDPRARRRPPRPACGAAGPRTGRGCCRRRMAPSGQPGEHQGPAPDHLPRRGHERGQQPELGRASAAAAPPGR